MREMLAFILLGLFGNGNGDQGNVPKDLSASGSPGLVIGIT
jgi:hypothetical protein